MLDNLIKLSNTNIVMLCERCGQEIHQKQQAARHPQDRPGFQDRPMPPQVERPVPPHMEPPHERPGLHHERPMPPHDRYGPSMDPRYPDYPEAYEEQDPYYQQPRQYYGSQYRVPQRRYQPRRFISNEQARQRF